MKRNLLFKLVIVGMVICLNLVVAGTARASVKKFQLASNKPNEFGISFDESKIVIPVILGMTSGRKELGFVVVRRDQVNIIQDASSTRVEVDIVNGKAIKVIIWLSKEAEIYTSKTKIKHNFGVYDKDLQNINWNDVKNSFKD